MQVLSPSSLSYTAALLASRQTVFSPDCWHVGPQEEYLGAAGWPRLKLWRSLPCGPRASWQSERKRRKDSPAH